MALLVPFRNDFDNFVGEDYLRLTTDIDYLAQVAPINPVVGVDNWVRLMDFANKLTIAVAEVTWKIGLGHFPPGAHGEKAEQRFLRVGAQRTYRAGIGYAIERGTYRELLGAYMLEPLPNAPRVYSDNEAMHMALEFSSAYGPFFPCRFPRSRPDVRLSLIGHDGKPKEAIFDITSERQQGHILRKKDNWPNKENAVFVAEILWQDADIMRGGQQELAMHLAANDQQVGAEVEIEADLRQEEVHGSEIDPQADFCSVDDV